MPITCCCVKRMRGGDDDDIVVTARKHLRSQLAPPPPPKMNDSIWWSIVTGFDVTSRATADVMTTLGATCRCMRALCDDTRLTLSHVPAKCARQILDARDADAVASMRARRCNGAVRFACGMTALVRDVRRRRALLCQIGTGDDDDRLSPLPVIMAAGGGGGDDADEYHNKHYAAAKEWFRYARRCAAWDDGDGRRASPLVNGASPAVALAIGHAKLLSGAWTDDGGGAGLRSLVVDDRDCLVALLSSRVTYSVLCWLAVERRAQLSRADVVASIHSAAIDCANYVWRLDRRIERIRQQQRDEAMRTSLAASRRRVRVAQWTMRVLEARAWTLLGVCAENATSNERALCVAVYRAAAIDFAAAARCAINDLRQAASDHARDFHLRRRWLLAHEMAPMLVNRQRHDLSRFAALRRRDLAHRAQSATSTTGERQRFERQALTWHAYEKLIRCDACELFEFAQLLSVERGDWRASIAWLSCLRVQRAWLASMSGGGGGGGGGDELKRIDVVLSNANAVQRHPPHRDTLTAAANTLMRWTPHSLCVATIIYGAACRHLTSRRRQAGINVASVVAH